MVAGGRAFASSEMLRFCLPVFYHCTLITRFRLWRETLPLVWTSGIKFPWAQYEKRDWPLLEMVRMSLTPSPLSIVPFKAKCTVAICFLTCVFQIRWLAILFKSQSPRPSTIVESTTVWSMSSAMLAYFGVISLGHFIGLKKSCLVSSTSSTFWVTFAIPRGRLFSSSKIKKINLHNQEGPFWARKAFLLRRSKSSSVKLHLLPSSLRQLSFTPVILCIRLLPFEINCPLAFPWYLA